MEKKTTNRRTWKNFETEVAKMFGTSRTPLSGAVQSLTRADTLHAKLFFECKLRNEDHPFVILHKIFSNHNKTVIACDSLLIMHDSVFDELYRTKLTVKKIRLTHKIVYKNLKSIVTLYDKTREKAEIEKKIPVVAIKIKSKRGFFLGFDLKDYQEILDYYGE